MVRQVEKPYKRAEFLNGSVQDRNLEGVLLNRESEVRILPDALPNYLQTSGKARGVDFASRSHYTNAGNLAANPTTRNGS